MKRHTMRRAATVVALCALALLGGCSDNSGTQDARGTWAGALSLSLAGGSVLDGDLTLVLEEADSFVSGGAEWAPIGETQSIAGPIDGIHVTLRLIFRCKENFETTVLEGTIDGETITIEDGSGKACTLGGTSTAVDGASATLTRSSDGAPF